MLLVAEVAVYPAPAAPAEPEGPEGPEGPVPPEGPDGPEGPVAPVASVHAAGAKSTDSIFHVLPLGTVWVEVTFNTCENCIILPPAPDVTMLYSIIDIL